MSINRKDFLKKVCISGACACGFGAVSLNAKKSLDSNSGVTAVQDANLTITQNWLAKLLSTINDDIDEPIKRKLIKQCAIVHYNNLKMDEMLAGYVGNLEKFIAFIEGEWGWKVDYNKETSILVANENKSYCVCPLINKQNNNKLQSLCYCSEGFAEKMFSTVIGKQVEATVISSIQRGDDSCRYKIVM